MSPTSFSSEPFPKKSRLGIASGTSLLEIWTTRIEKENAKKHVPFAGERSLGEKAKLYLSLERKDNDGSNDRSGVQLQKFDFVIYSYEFLPFFRIFYYYNDFFRIEFL